MKSSALQPAHSTVGSFLASRRTVLSAMATSALLLAGCSSNAPAPSSSASGSPQSGGILTHAVPALDDGWQQQSSNNWYKSQVWAQLVETLVYVDDEGEVHPWLATAWEASADGLTYTFTLRDDVTYSDGTALTAQNVARNLNILGLGDPEEGISRSSMIPLEFKAAKATGDDTVEVTLSSRNDGFLPSLGFFAAGMLADATLDLPLEEQSDLANTVGSGPFVFESQTAGEKITIKRRDDYNWASEAFDHDGPAYLDKIVYVVLPEDSTRSGALESAQIDSLHYVQPADEERLASAGWNVVHAPYFGTPINIVMRPEAEIVDDPKVRQALQVGINRQELVDTVYNSQWHPATSVIQQASPGWVDLSAELAYDPDKANLLLDEAGWDQKDADGIRTKDGVALELPGYTSPNLNTSPQLIELIGQQLLDLGIKLTVQKTDATTYLDIFNSTQTQMIPTANTFLDPATLAQYWGSGATNQFLLTAGSGAEKDLAALLAAVVQTSAGTQERDAAAEALQRAVVEQAYSIPLVDNYQVYVTSPSVQGWVTNAVGRPYLYDVWKVS